MSNIKKDINRIKYILEFGKKTGIQYVLETDDEKSLNNILNELERLQKENEKLKGNSTTKKDKKFLNEVMSEDDEFYADCEWCGGRLYENFICSVCGLRTETK